MLFGVLTIDCGGSVFVFVDHYEEERSGCFAFIVLRISCYCICSLTLTVSWVGLRCVCLWHFLIIITYILIYEAVYVKGASAFVPEITVCCQMRYRLEELLEICAPVIKMNCTLLFINKLGNIVSTPMGLVTDSGISTFVSTVLPLHWTFNRQKYQSRWNFVWPAFISEY